MRTKLTNKDWDKLFDLLVKLYNQGEGVPFSETAAEVMEQAIIRKRVEELLEFASWFQDEEQQ